MSGPSTVKEVPVETREQLVAFIAEGEKPRDQWLIGTEHEKFGFRTDDLRPPTYDGERGIGALLQGLTRFGWERIEENGTLIALSRGLGMGFQPKWRRDEMPWMPKGRYKIMREYMPKRGSLGLDMMTRTCTVQVNLDFADEADMVRKFRVSLALQPIATALFADSPFTEGKPNGYLSYRSHIWTDTDPNRTGMLDFVFEDGFGFERYVDYLLDVPMYFTYRGGEYIDCAGRSFRDFMAGKLPNLPGALPTLADWADHMTTAFPEVRLKKYLEMRGADGGPWNRLCALPAFWVGLLYDDAALDAAWDLVKDFSMTERNALRDGVPQHALKTPFRAGTLRDLAIEALKISGSGLARRNRLNAGGATEAVFLEPLVEFALANETPAERKLKLFHGAWNGSVDPVFREFAY